MGTDTHRAMRRLARRKFDQLGAWWHSSIQTLPVRTPPRGWIAAVRQAWGMSKKDLAARLHVAPSAVNGFEDSERAGTIQLDTLRRVAEALGCEVVVVVVPRMPMQSEVDRQRLAMFDKLYSTVSRHMELEGQEASEAVREELLREAEQSIPDRELWNELEGSVLPGVTRRQPGDRGRNRRKAPS